MNVLSLLGCKDTVELIGLALKIDCVVLNLIVTVPFAHCPQCGHRSTRVHSSYERQVADLPWVGKMLRMNLQVRRFFCDNKSCQQKIFAERLHMVPVYARQTKRLQHQLTQVASQLGGRPGAQLATLLGMPVSYRKLLRLLLQTNEQPVLPPKVLGVDDWALKKGKAYGTILVDIEKQRPIELLPDREAETLATWLQRHPGVEVITRDRAGSYADGAKQGAPNAIQVADRWHLIKNLGDALKRMLEQYNPQLRAAARQVAKCVQEEQYRQNEQQALQATDIVGPSVSLSSPTALRALRFHEAKKLLAEGYSLRAVSRMLKISRQSVTKYQYYSHYPAKRQPKTRQSTVLPWKEYLVQRWSEGEHNHKQLWREIQQQGFTGGNLCVYRFFAQFKETKQVKLPELEVKNWSPSRVQFLLSKAEEDLLEEEKEFLQVFFEHCPSAATARKLALAFRTILKQKNVEALSIWILEAKTSGIAALKNFARGLESDFEAVKAAATYHWSNGPVEGHVNRLKTIKRKMYGRAGFDLLRKRVLFYPDTG